MSDLRLADLTPLHHDAARRLILNGLEEHWGELDATLNADLDDLAASYGHGRTIVALEADSAVGTGTLVPRPDKTAEILRMSVSQTHRRAGVGRMLVDELVATAVGWSCDRVILETSSAWTEVVSFYRSCGFGVTHLEDGDFGSDTWFELKLS